MVTLVADIRTPNWQMATSGFGVIVTDADDILLCIHNILFTQKGQVPFDPEFGTNIYRYIDGPVNAIIPFIIKEITEGIQLYEPRVTLVSVVPTINTDNSIRFSVNMQIANSAASLAYNLDLSDSAGSRAFSDEFNQVYS